MRPTDDKVGNSRSPAEYSKRRCAPSYGVEGSACTPPSDAWHGSQNLDRLIFFRRKHMKILGGVQSIPAPFLPEYTGHTNQPLVFERVRGEEVVVSFQMYPNAPGSAVNE